MAIHVITHNDLDGVGPVILTKLIDDKVTYDLCAYKQIDQVVEDFMKQDLSVYDQILLTDISISEKNAEKIDTVLKENPGLKINLIDHHVTAEWLNQYEWATVKSNYDKEEHKDAPNKTAATSLVYDFLKENHSKESIEQAAFFTEMVRQYDTWEWVTVYDNKIPKEINGLLTLMGQHTFIKETVEKFKGKKEYQKANEFVFTEKEQQILDYEEKKKKRYFKEKIKSSFLSHLEGYNVLFVFAEQYKSELGNYLAQEVKEADFVSMIDLSTKTISYRTIKEDVDVSTVAKQFDGGGHPKASGSPISESVIQNLLGSLFR